MGTKVVGWMLSVGVLCWACGGKEAENESNGTGGVQMATGGAHGGVMSTASGGSNRGGASGDDPSEGGSANAGTGGDGPEDCRGKTTTLASEYSAGSCTAIVRLDYLTLKQLGHAFVCGGASSLNEAQARATASADVELPYTSDIGEGDLLSGSSPNDAWVFYQSPGDFGGVAAVSAVSGLTVFAGSIVWSGTGEAAYPKDWSSTDLGTECYAEEPPIPVRGFDLSENGKLANAAQIAEPVLRSALIPAFKAKGGHAETALVLLYPRTVGAFDPTVAEYVVLVNGRTAGN